MIFCKFLLGYLVTEIARAGAGPGAREKACDIAGVWEDMSLLSVGAIFETLSISSCCSSGEEFWQGGWQVRALAIEIADKVLKARLQEIFLFFFQMSRTTR